MPSESYQFRVLSPNARVVSKSAVSNLDVLRDFLRQAQQLEFSECWLDGDKQDALCLLTNRDKAFLMYLRNNEGDRA